MKSEDLKNEAPWIILINNQCNAVFINKLFLLSSKNCITQILKTHNRKLYGKRNCGDNHKFKIKSVHFHKDLALLKISKVIKIPD